MADTDKPTGMGMRPYLDALNKWATDNLPEGVSLEEFLEWASGDYDRHQLESEVSKLRDALAERDELIEAFQHTIEYIHTQSQGRAE